MFICQLGYRSPNTVHHGMKRFCAYRQAYAVGKIGATGEASSLKLVFERELTIF